jgi:hypothetical protein
MAMTNFKARNNEIKNAAPYTLQNGGDISRVSAIGHKRK